MLIIIWLFPLNYIPLPTTHPRTPTFTLQPNPSPQHCRSFQTANKKIIWPPWKSTTKLFFLSIWRLALPLSLRVSHFKCPLSTSISASPMYADSAFAIAIAIATIHLAGLLVQAERVGSLRVQILDKLQSCDISSCATTPILRDHDWFRSLDRYDLKPDEQGESQSATQ